jgi:molecular chaperone GrpE
MKSKDSSTESLEQGQEEIQDTKQSEACVEAEQSEKVGLENSNTDDSSADSPFTVKDKRSWASDEIEDLKDIEEQIEKEPSYVTELKRKAEESEKKLLEYIDAYKKKLQEHDGIRKRLEANLAFRLEQAKGDILLSLLPLHDNLGRAISSAKSSSDFGSFKEGILMVQKMFSDQMNQIGLQPIETVGKPFDPVKEEAIAVCDVSKEEEDNIVLEVFERGYLFDNRLLRPAKVRVGRFKSQDN